MTPMKLSAIALDYDGTIAEHGALDAEVRHAIDMARDRNIAVVLVTGRILADLQRVAGDLRFVDAIVAENGAVVALPQQGRQFALTPARHEGFPPELAARAIKAEAG